MIQTNTLAARAWPRTSSNAALRGAVLVVLGSALIAVSAHVQVPFWPVKLSMQTFVVLALGVAYGSRLAGATVLAYLAEGAIGLPVFQSGGGLVYFGGPTTGYLVGLVLAAVAVGAFAERGTMRSPLPAAGVLLLGEVLIYVPGLLWLTHLFGFEKAIAFGLVPFLPAEAFKVALATALVPVVRRVAR